MFESHAADAAHIGTSRRPPRSLWSANLTLTLTTLTLNLALTYPNPTLTLTLTLTLNLALAPTLTPTLTLAVALTLISLRSDEVMHEVRPTSAERLRDRLVQTDPDLA